MQKLRVSSHRRKDRSSEGQKLGKAKVRKAQKAAQDQETNLREAKERHIQKGKRAEQPNLSPNKFHETLLDFEMMNRNIRYFGIAGQGQRMNEI